MSSYVKLCQAMNRDIRDMPPLPCGMWMAEATVCICVSWHVWHHRILNSRPGRQRIASGQCGAKCPKAILTQRRGTSNDTRPFIPLPIRYTSEASELLNDDVRSQRGAAPSRKKRATWIATWRCSSGMRAVWPPCAVKASSKPNQARTRKSALPSAISPRRMPSRIS